MDADLGHQITTTSLLAIDAVHELVFRTHQDAAPFHIFSDFNALEVIAQKRKATRARICIEVIFRTRKEINAGCA